MPALQIQRLRKRYGDLEAVKGISFSVEKGDFFGFIGPNGAGKTTTIESIVGLLHFKGRIRVLGHDIVKDARAAKRKLGLSPQEFNFDRFLTCFEVLYYTAGYYGIARREAARRADELLKRFGLAEKRDKRAEQLSGGMKRRLIIARALIHEPEILILDEPTAGLDVELRRDLWAQLERINKEGVTIILTSHYIEEVEKLCNRVGIINHGRIVKLGGKHEIMEELANETLRLRVSKRIPDDLLDEEVRHEEGCALIVGKGVKKRAPAILKRVEAAGITVKELDIYRESLENIFLRLTGENHE